MASGQLSAVLSHVRQLLGRRSSVPSTDAHLLERFAGSRDEAAFAELVQRHGPMVQRLCRGILHNAHDADDAFQATFLVLARSSGSIRKRDSLASWLYGVAYRIAVRAKSSADRRRDEESKAPPRLEEDSASEADMHELHALLHEELARLPEKYRAPLVLCYLQGKSHQQAADELGCVRGSMAKRLAGAQERLRHRLAQRGVALSAAGLVTALAEQEATAALSAGLVDSTVKAAVTFTAGGATGGAAATAAALMAQGALKMMLYAKIKMTVLMALSLLVVGSGAGLVAYRAIAGGGQAAATEALADPGTRPAPKAAAEPEAAQPRAERVFVQLLNGQDKQAEIGEFKPAADWLQREIARLGAPQSVITLGWTEVTDQQRVLFTSSMGGRVIKAQVVERKPDGAVVVEISGLKIKPLSAKYTLDPAKQPTLVVNLTGYPGAGNIYAALALASAPPLGAIVKASDPVVKDGLQATVRPTRPVFAVNQALLFVVTLRNVSDKPLRLHDASQHKWSFWANTGMPGEDWVAALTVDIKRAVGPPVELKPREMLEVPVVLGDLHQFRWQGSQNRPIGPRQFLPAGKYGLRVGIRFAPFADNNPVPCWSGALETKAVEVEVADKAVDSAQARQIAYDWATVRWPGWRTYHRGADAIKSVSAVDDGAVWKVEFSADNGLKANSAVIQIDAKTGRILEVRVIPGA